MRTTLCLVLAGTLLAHALPAAADDDPDYRPGPWHFHAVSCVDTTITDVEPRLDIPDESVARAIDESGVQVTFATRLGIAPLFHTGTAEVVHYQGDDNNAIMAAEHKGQRVQVCYLGGPAPTERCNPDTDDRGRRYRVYDYAQHKQYWGMNSEHDCGGA